MRTPQRQSTLTGASTPGRRAAVAQGGERIGAALALLALVALAVVGLNLVALRLSPAGYTLDIGERQDRASVPGFHGAERDAAGTSYRWTNGAAVLILRGPAIPQPAVVTLRLGWLPPGAAVPRQVVLTHDQSAWTTLEAPDQPRHYKLLLPPGELSDGVVRIGLQSEVTVAPGDERPLGVRVDAATISWAEGAWRLPPLIVLLAQAGLLLAWVTLARALGLGMPAAAGVAVLLLLALVAHAALDPGLAAPYQGRLLVGGLAGAAVVWGAGQVLPRVEPDASPAFVRALLLITLAALVVRLLGVLYPLFFSHDLLINSGRMRTVQFGDLAIFDRHSEFGRRISIVPPSVYLLALPGALVSDRGMALQGLYTILEGTTPLLTALLARRLGLSERAALIAAGLIALLPMQLTALYWGFAAQIVAQWITLLFLVVLAGPPPRRSFGWVAVGTLGTVSLLAHPGGLLLAGVGAGLFLLLGLWPRIRAVASGRLPVRALLAGEAYAFWRGWTLTLAGAAASAFVLHYVDAFLLMLGSSFAGPAAASESTGVVHDQSARLWQIWVGLNASFAPLPLLLVAAGLGALLWRTRGPGRLLVSAWLGSALLFLVVDLLTGMQVRYGYFSAPLVCAGLAALVEPVLPRRLGRVAAWGLVAFVVLSGLVLWSAAIYAGVKPSVNPLTH